MCFTKRYFVSLHLTIHMDMLGNASSISCEHKMSFILQIKSIFMESYYNGPLTRCVKLRVTQAPGMPGTFSAPLRASNPDMHHGSCVTHVPWCIPGLLTSDFLWRWWRGKRSRHSQRMRNPQFCVYLVRGPCTGFLWDSWVTQPTRFFLLWYHRVLLVVY